MKRTLVVVIVLLLSAAVTAPAQDPVTGAFAGTVFNGKTREPFKGATVTLTNVATGVKYRRVTDDGGNFYVGRLIPGVYRIEISAPDFKTFTVEQRLLITQVSTVLPVPIMLEPSGDSDAGAKVLTPPAAGLVNELPDNARRYAVVIGVDKYTADDQIAPLRGAANDARAIADALVSYAGFSREHVLLLTSDAPEISSQPTKAVILKALRNLKNFVEEDSMLLMAFSGHGVERRSDHKTFLLPADALANPDELEETALSVERLKELIGQTRAAYVMLLLDSARNDPFAGKGVEDNKITKNYLDAFNLRGGHIKAFVTLYAASEGQRAWEYVDKKQGYFSWAFVEGLKGAARDPATGEVTLGRLIEYIQSEVPRRAKLAGREQTPYVVMEGYAGRLVISKGAR
jgi:hypothetical protein